MNAATETRRLYRDPTDRVAAGVAAGLAGHLGASPIVIRVAFVLLASFNGLGALLYAAFWAVLPMPPHIPARPRHVGQLLSFLAVGLGILLIQNLAGAGGGIQTFLGWIVAIVALGAGVLWHQADPKRRQRWSAQVPQMPWLGAFMEHDRRAYLLRFVGGGLLVVVGIIGALVVGLPQFRGATLGAVLYGLVFAVIALGGLGLALAPLLWRMFGQLRAEREARIREQERAELAAMIHDQVLHTLALIQRNSADVKMVTRLARGQERTLRSWLYKSVASPTERFSAAMEQIAAEVEDTYAIAVETVVVGDLDVDEPIAALVAAAREALVNAARHAKVSTISLYAEVEDDMVSAFVRDRGAGFDISTVEEDRHGVKGSIIGRMQRHGGRAEIRSEVGDGTEVRLIMPINIEVRRRRAEENG
jgi:signal transduction histidine kinase/phage shock protein PspC (stress-responsive transcriptional regulator)